MTLKQVLTIAGSDSGGGAGIQADLKAMWANGVFAMSVITAITAQNTEEVTDVFELPISIIAAQIDAVFDDFEVSAVKTGMLPSADIVVMVAKMLRPQHVTNLVVDPVMISKSGQALLKPDAMEALKHDLIPLALVVTPNVHEAQELSGIQIESLGDARQAAKAIHKLGCKHVLIKGATCRPTRGPISSTTDGSSRSTRANSSRCPTPMGPGAPSRRLSPHNWREENLYPMRSKPRRRISPKPSAIP